MQNSNPDTIVALATPPGLGGVAIVRVSGPQVKKIICEVVGKELVARHATYCCFLDAVKQSLDAGVAIFFPGPHSFTGEDVVEFQGHGGPVIADLLIQRILQIDARLARPGEFSERAFLNGKLDLAQAEAIADLINASSAHAARLAFRSLQGNFSKAIHLLVEKIIHLRMFIEAAIDFSDEEINFLSNDKVKLQLEEIINQLNSIENNAKQGSFLREGISAVIMGEPNVGKSSLINFLSGKEIAIVTDIPGTTRDILREHILIDDMPIHIIDTAGLRDSNDIVEQEGIRRAYQQLEQADIILYVVDALRQFDLNNLIANLQNKNLNDKPVIFIRNKIDLLNESPAVVIEKDKIIVSISIKKDLGMELLKQQIKAQVGFKSDAQGIYLARRRHLDALSRAKTHVYAAAAMLHLPELAAEDLRLTQLALNEITGEFTSDDLLGKIFSSFCIGK